MASIRCKTCGRTYDYGKEGFCPNCGAYNRPPRQAWVGAVLTVVIAVVVVSVLRGLVGHTGFDLSHREPGHSGEAGSPAEEIRPAVWERAEVGAHFTLGENADETTSVDAVWIDEDEKLHAVVTLEETYQSFPSLFGTDGNGGEYQHWLESIKDTEKGAYTFECIYDLSYRPHDNMQMVFYGIDKEVWVDIMPAL